MRALKVLSIISLFTLLFSSPANANEIYVCKISNLVRTISIEYENSDSKLPCRVMYDKGSGPMTKWVSHHQEGYCEEKAAAFVEKQRGWGWHCDKQQ